MPSPRHLLLGLALVLTIAASVWDGPAASSDSAPARASTPAHAQPAPAAGAAKPTEPAQERLHRTKTNAFAAHSWQPPVKPVKAPPPPPPRAPALPFAYIGKMQDGAAVTVFVSQGGRSLVLRSGDTLPNYRVESISPTDMTFVYLPLNEKQRLTFGSPN